MPIQYNEPGFLRGPSVSPPCWDLLPLSILAAACLLLGATALALRVYSEHKEWIVKGMQKKREDSGEHEKGVEELLELEAGRRYNIPVEYFRNMEIRIR
jgi:hypothetical protein